jgi:hypothetical protein
MSKRLEVLAGHFQEQASAATASVAPLNVSAQGIEGGIVGQDWDKHPEGTSCTRLSYSNPSPLLQPWLPPGGWVRSGYRGRLVPVVVLRRGNVSTMIPQMFSPLHHSQPPSLSYITTTLSAHPTPLGPHPHPHTTNSLDTTSHVPPNPLHILASPPPPTTTPSLTATPPPYLPAGIQYPRPPRKHGGACLPEWQLPPGRGGGGILGGGAHDGNHPLRPPRALPPRRAQRTIRLHGSTVRTD